MEKYDVTQPIKFTYGMYQVNPEPNSNYQLNRVVHWNGGTVWRNFFSLFFIFRNVAMRSICLKAPDKVEFIRLIG